MYSKIHDYFDVVIPVVRIKFIIVILVIAYQNLLELVNIIYHKIMKSLSFYTIKYLNSQPMILITVKVVVAPVFNRITAVF